MSAPTIGVGSTISPRSSGAVPLVTGPSSTTSPRSNANTGNGGNGNMNESKQNTAAAAASASSLSNGTKENPCEHIPFRLMLITFAIFITYLATRHHVHGIHVASKSLNHTSAHAARAHSVAHATQRASFTSSSVISSPTIQPATNVIGHDKGHGNIGAWADRLPVLITVATFRGVMIERLLKSIDYPIERIIVVTFFCSNLHFGHHMYVYVPYRYGMVWMKLSVNQLIVCVLNVQI
jgi:hypothetical protein